MNRMLADLRKRYDELERQEQRALLGLAAFLLLVVFYLGFWSPAGDYVADSRLDYDRRLELLAWLRSTEAEARAADKPQAADGQSLLTTVSRTAQAVGINPSRMQPEGSEAVSVWFDAVIFTQLMLWLERLETGEGIVVRQITIDRRDRPGQVSARLVLRVGGG